MRRHKAYNSTSADQNNQYDSMGKETAKQLLRSIGLTIDHTVREEFKAGDLELTLVDQLKTAFGTSSEMVLVECECRHSGFTNGPFRWPTVSIPERKTGAQAKWELYVQRSLAGDRVNLVVKDSIPEDVFIVEAKMAGTSKKERFFPRHEIPTDWTLRLKNENGWKTETTDEPFTLEMLSKFISTEKQRVKDGKA